MADLSFETKPYTRILRELADEKPDAPVITCGTDTVTRAQLESRSNRTARAYAKLGVGEGDFVTIGLPNSIEFYVALVATWKIGAVPQPVSPRLPATERQAIVELANSRLVLGGDPDEHPDRVTLGVGFVSDLLLDDSALPEIVSPAARAPTSGGSTGRPKLIVTGNRAEGPAGGGVGFHMAPNDVHLVPGPLYHNAPLSLSVAGLLMGHHLVVLPRFDAVVALDMISQHGVTWMNLVPTMMARMLRAIEVEPGRFDLSTLRIVWHMAAPCADWLKQAWIDLVGPEKLHELYGGTEAQSATMISGTEWLTHRGSVGRPAFGEMKILDAMGAPAAPGEVGEIYMRRPVGAAPTYRYIGAEAKELDGWETLGDLGSMDADGFVYLSDRRTDLILQGGANIYPAEVEAAIDSHPHVLSSVVVGLPDDDLGQRVHALVQTDEVGVTYDDLAHYLADRLVRYKIPRSIELIDEPMRDDAGKARRSAMRDAAVARLSGSIATADLPKQDRHG
jgi:bile acid-coenzyme A ligase